MSARSFRPAVGSKARAGRRRAAIACLAYTGIAALVAWPALAAERASKEGIEFFEKKIRPVLAKNCYSCHSGSIQARGGLRLDTRVGLLIGGQSGPAISPGQPEKSKILSVLHYEGPEMPPAGQLSKETIDDFQAWIAMGAPDPRDDELKYNPKRKIDFAAERRKWVYRAPKKPALPVVVGVEWAWSPVDRFILARQREVGTQPVKDAAPIVWLRRVTFDLVGLPPTRDQIAAIERDSSRRARAELVDRLLASPQYGERWGRHWLDIARFAESTGKERNLIYPQAWRYRDWVIDALNADKPYDQFLREQIAGDLLAAGDASERDARIIATGFLALGPKGINERNRESYLLDIADEQIENVSRAVMGLSVGCARCHDHKFDPVTMGDYYALAGIFRSSETRAGVTNRQYNAGQPAFLVELTSTGTSLASLADPRLLAALKRAERERQARLDTLRRAREQASAEVLAAVAAVTPDQQNILAMLPRRGPDGHLATDLPPPRRKPGPPPDPASFEDIRDKQQALIDAFIQVNGLKEELGRQTARATAIAMADAPHPGDINIHLRGEADKLGPVVPRGFPQVVAVADPPAIGPAESGRRQLSDWLTRPDHPLTSRVIVNRLWAKLFGAGIVPTPDDFGEQGQKPTNPELLDFLAVRFVVDGWSIKRLLKELVLSRTYQLSDEDAAANLAKDEANESLWRWSRRRLDAETLRDGVLAVGGRLDLTRPDGSPVIELGLRELGPTSDFGPVQRPSRHRSVYLPVLRNKAPEALAIFDLPDPSLVAGQREITTSAAQALFLLNSPFILEQSEHLARCLLAEPGLDAAARVERAYLAVLSRRPAAAERDRVLRFLAASRSSGVRKADADELGVWTRFAQSLLALPEFRYLF
jgi:hypothetical protein